METGMLVAIGVALLGASLMVVLVSRGRQFGPDLADFLPAAEAAPYESRMAEPFVRRMSRIVGGAVGERLERLLPRQHMARIERQLAMAGLEGQRRAGTQLATQVGLALFMGVLALLMRGAAMSPTMQKGLILMPVMGFMVPSARLERRIRTRTDTIFKDLPDIIDMLAVAVEAGCGFDAALSIVCQHFESPMADELRLALQGMELGMPRREVLQELKRRTDLDVVRTFVVALIQADGLGIPIGRVLTTQANEIRSRRRAWAREKAAKLPVKIMFPLVLFIFPPIMAIVIGPAFGAFQNL
ncbi:MAG TPA: type II secretion system F family protein [Acidimicrobiales bacterium]|nr:type II secretion system F family protein [Acidimicrobiales bacterium]